MAAPPAHSQPPSTNRLELTLRSTLVGLVLSVIMGAANVYLGLKAGMTVSASIPASVVGMLILRGLFRRGSVLEANQIQTAASAGESIAAGIIFTMPALLLIGVWKDFDMLTTTAVAFAGGLLGILFMIPMRRVFVVDNDELPYPEGVACAAVLTAGARSLGEEEPSSGAVHGDGEAGVRNAAEGDDDAGPSRAEGAVATSDASGIVWGALLGAAFKAGVSFFGVLAGTLETAAVAAGRSLYLGADISPALLAVGYIVRLNVALLLALGGALGWWVLMPLLPELGQLLEALSPSLGYDLALPESALDRAWGAWSGGVRYIGVGAMLVGGVASIVRVRHGLVAAVTQLRSQLSSSSDGSLEPTSRDLAPRTILSLIGLAVLIIVGVYYGFTGSVGTTLLTTALMLVMSFFFVAVASYIVGLVGNSNSPVSGMTITAVLFTGALLWVLGYAGTEGMVATLGVAAIVCCAACTSGDVCNDLKTGSLVGATPRNQQLVQVLGVAVASLIMAPVLELLHGAYTIGSRELSAPQAGLFASLARGFFGDGKLPWGLVLVGACLGALVLVLDRGLEKRRAVFRLHLMPLAVGLYLPFGLSLPILAGGVLAHLHERMSAAPSAATGRSRASESPALQRGVLVASGIIAGESLVGVVIALLVSVGVAAMEPRFLGREALTLAAAVAVLVAFHRRSRPAR